MPIADKIRPVVRSLIAQLVDHGYEAYIVGGAVRDLMLDLVPKDYDLATSATPEQIRKVFGKRKARIIGRRFKLVHVYAHGEAYEVSTFRRQPTEEERRGRITDDGVMIWRDNVFGTLEEDAQRRDFTANALYYDPVGDRGVIDFCGGLDDLKNRRVRCIGQPETRFGEDPVRMLRALKLVGQFGFQLEPGVQEVLHRQCELITLASRSRLLEELHKVLACSKALPILEAFREHGLLTHLWPGIDRVWDEDLGLITRSFLAERDRRRTTIPGYTTSKAVALATVALPFVVNQLRQPECQSELWDYESGIEHGCRTALHEFMMPFPLSRYFSSRMRDMLLLLPRLLTSVKREKLLRHPEYKYGRELLSLLITVKGWDASMLDPWPEIDMREERKPRRTRRRRGGASQRRRPRHPENPQKGSPESPS